MKFREILMKKFNKWSENYGSTIRLKEVNIGEDMLALYSTDKLIETVGIYNHDMIFKRIEIIIEDLCNRISNLSGIQINADEYEINWNNSGHIITGIWKGHNENLLGYEVDMITLHK